MQTIAALSEREAPLIAFLWLKISNTFINLKIELDELYVTSLRGGKYAKNK